MKQYMPDFLEELFVKYLKGSLLELLKESQELFLNEWNYSERTHNDIPKEISV